MFILCSSCTTPGLPRPEWKAPELALEVTSVLAPSQVELVELVGSGVCMFGVHI